MYGQPQVTVRDRETGHVYDVSEKRFKSTPELWERIGPNPPKPRTTVSKEAGRKKAASPVSKTADAPAPDEKADDPATEEEN